MIINHTAYQVAEGDLREALAYFDPGHMIFLIGPSGVGKTTLRRAVMREHLGHPKHWGTGRIPMIEVIANLPHNAIFSSKELAIELNTQLLTPSLKWLQPHGSGDLGSTDMGDRTTVPLDDSWDMVRSARSSTEGEYWRSFKRMLQARHCRYVCIDQATALLVNKRDTDPKQHTQHLMALAEEAGVMFIMTGVPAITGLWGINSELRRRVTPVWMPPYSANNDDDVISFRRVLKSLESNYVFERTTVLRDLHKEILMATGGIFAEVVQLLDRARRSSKRRGQKGIARADIISSVYNETDIQNIWDDVKDFDTARKEVNVAGIPELLAVKRKAKVSRRPI